jgi:pyruvate, water dikinase
LAGLLFSVQDHFAASVYPSISPLMLDLEVDVTRDGRTVIKQTRPYTQ